MTKRHFIYSLLHIFQICRLAPIENSRSVIVPITEKSKYFYKNLSFVSHWRSLIGLYYRNSFLSFVIGKENIILRILTEKNYAMARPKKDKELEHKHQIMLRLTDTEYEIVSESAKAAHLPLTEYVRKQVMEQKVTAKYEIVADLPELKNWFGVWKDRQQLKPDCKTF